MEGTAPDEPGIRLPPAEALATTAPADVNGPAPGDVQAQLAKEHAEEVDVWYGSYAGRAMLPQFLQLCLLSILIVVVAVSLGAWRGVNAPRYTALGLLALLWLAQLLRWFHHVLFLNYRLTTRHLFCQRGIGHPAQPGVPLKCITQIMVEASRMERWLDVGRVRIFLQDAPSPIILEGVRHPFHVIRQIQRRKAAR